MTQRSTDQDVAGAAEGASDVTDSRRESLSALMDGEASELELRRVLKLADTDPGILVRWKRYHLIRAAMQGDLNAAPNIDLSDRISAAIALEPSLQNPMQDSMQGVGRLKQWRDGVGKAAIAASVAVAFVVGVQQFGAVDPQGPAQVVDVETRAPEPVNIANAPTGFELPPFAARTVSTGSGPANTAAAPFAHSEFGASQTHDSQALQNYFNHLLLKHAERSSASGSMGLLPFARVSRMDSTQE